MEQAVIKVLATSTVTFLAGIALAPFITHFLYKHKMWKKKAGKGAGYGGGATPLFNELHKEHDTNTPRMGGLVIWLSILCTLSFIVLAKEFAPNSILASIDFLSRSQTWLPLAALLVGAVVGFIDDYFIVRGIGKHFADGGLPLRNRLAVVAVTSGIIAWWFYAKLGVETVSFLGFEPITLGIVFIPFFIITAVAVYASGIIDGIDGLSGGVFLFIFSAYTGIAMYQGQIDLAAFCAAIVGGILAFLWFNIPPARFYMTETGIMALTMALTVVAFMTDTIVDGMGVSMLPIVGILLVVTVASNIIQVLSKKLRGGKKVFLIAPLHHHFEAIGWPREKVAMRYWIIGFVAAIFGLLLTITL